MGECPTPCKKGGGIFRGCPGGKIQGELSGSRYDTVILSFMNEKRVAMSNKLPFFIKYRVKVHSADSND